ncbi:hypothetical protein COV11_03680 [Candidatus Woesearchaeota archaeon CG10_big_fil_rev_8_21_14_0_10_30_7]|nr:MAG: hypothetical protein COV11_03680 [Candidatus Woesearchaeota archaeon CG10_big_fil_rev_8_21_14_0_10_30_7]
MGLKKLISSLVLATGLICTPNIAKAEEVPKRELKLDLQNPVTNFEANSNYWYSADQIVGKGSDVLYENWKNNLATKGGAFFLDWYATHFFRFLTHELGHVREGKRYGEFKTGWDGNHWVDFNQNFIKEYQHEHTDEQFFQAAISGLNQDEHNSYMTFKNNLDRLSVHDAFCFLSNKWYDVDYIMTGPPAEEGGDPANYIERLNDKGINLELRDYFLQAIVADTLSLQTWDSLEVIGDYLAFGATSKKPFMFRLGRTLFTPPLINHYLTTKGSFYNITSIINPNNSQSTELSFATPVNFIGDGKVDKYRLGGQLNNIPVGKYQFSPFYYVTTNTKFNHEGYSAGFELKKQLNKSVDFRVKLEHNDKDLLENSVKGEREGFNVVLGFDIKF